MNLLHLASAAQSLGLNVSLAAVGPLIPLLSKRAIDIDDADVRAVLNVLGAKAVPDVVVVELVSSVHESNVDNLADLLGRQEYLMPIVTRVKAFINGKVAGDEETLPDEIPTKCPACDAESVISRKAFMGLSPDSVVDITCVECLRPRPVRVSKITLNGV